jgi:hypothetical protein
MLPASCLRTIRLGNESKQYTVFNHRFAQIFTDCQHDELILKCYLPFALKSAFKLQFSLQRILNSVKIPYACEGYQQVGESPTLILNLFD